MPIKILIILTIIYFCLSCPLSANEAALAGDIADVNALLDAAGNQEMNIPEMEKNPAANKIAEKFHSPEYQKNLQDQIAALKSKLYPDAEASGPPPISRKDDHRNALLMPDERIYLFVSSSIPRSTLKTYAADLDKLKDENIVMVMRGFVDGVKYIKPTLDLISNVLKKDPACDSSRNQCDAFQAGIHIDPVLFSRYDIQTVPAIVYARGVRESNLEAGQGRDENQAGDAFRVSGDVTLEYALEMILKETRSSQIETILKKLRRGFY